MGIVFGIIVGVLVWLLPPILILRNKTAKASTKAIWAGVSFFSPFIFYVLWGVAVSAFLKMPSITFQDVQAPWFQYLGLAVKVINFTLPWLMYVLFLRKVERSSNIAVERDAPQAARPSP